ncbi:MAG: hypothetical protein L3V56_14935 [Candidatus Magnetoovum sp. WYHC-5]|nr:hypothetical protein [Candidatus Magnetoovum sp. WYHC-5]
MLIKKMNDKGFALVITLLFAMIGLALSGALLYLTVQTTKIGGIGQRYATALDAAKAAGEVALAFIDNYDSTAGTVPDYYDPTYYDTNCIKDKLTTSTLDTAGGNFLWTQCTAGSQNDYTSMTASTMPDIVFDLGEYRAFTKVVDTKVVGSTYYYTVEILTYKLANEREKAQISLVYKK